MRRLRPLSVNTYSFPAACFLANELRVAVPVVESRPVESRPLGVAENVPPSPHLTHVPLMTCVAPRISCRPFPEQSFPSRSSPMHSGHRTSRAVGGPIPPLPGKPLINPWKIAWRAPFGYARRLPGAPQAEGEALREPSSRTTQRKKCFFPIAYKCPVCCQAPRACTLPRPVRRPRSRLRLVPLIALPARRPRPTGYQHPAPTPPAPASPPMQDSCSVWCFSSNIQPMLRIPRLRDC